MSGSPLAAPREVRFRWYRQVDQCGRTVPEVCAIFGVSKKTYHKWYRRDHGYGSNRYRSRKPHPHTKLTPELRIAVYEAKIRYNYGPAKMRLHLQRTVGITVSTTTIYRFFKRRRLIRKPQKKLPWYQPMRERYVARMPGENVQVDVKYIPGPDQTWQYQFRFVDTFSGMQFAMDCLDRSATTAISTLRCARRSFPFPILGIQTDNGGEFRGGFAVYVQRCGIVHRFIPKRSAPWNGKVERANRAVDDEYYLNDGRPWQTLAAYVRWYNHERPHLGRHMHGMTPYEKFKTYVTPAAEQSPLKVH